MRSSILESLLTIGVSVGLVGGVGQVEINRACKASGTGIHCIGPGFSVSGCKDADLDH